MEHIPPPLPLLFYFSCFYTYFMLRKGLERGLVRALQGLELEKRIKIKNKGGGGGHLCSKSKTRDCPNYSFFICYKVTLQFKNVRLYVRPKCLGGNVIFSAIPDRRLISCEDYSIHICLSLCCNLPIAVLLILMMFEIYLHACIFRLKLNSKGLFHCSLY